MTWLLENRFPVMSNWNSFQGQISLPYGIFVFGCFPIRCSQNVKFDYHYLNVLTLLVSLIS